MVTVKVLLFTPTVWLSVFIFGQKWPLVGKNPACFPVPLKMLPVK
jgi:hypothetical protein